MVERRGAVGGDVDDMSNCQDQANNPRIRPTAKDEVQGVFSSILACKLERHELLFSWDRAQ